MTATFRDADHIHPNCTICDMLIKPGEHVLKETIYQTVLRHGHIAIDGYQPPKSVEGATTPPLPKTMVTHAVCEMKFRSHLSIMLGQIIVAQERQKQMELAAAAGKGPETPSGIALPPEKKLIITGS